MYNVYTCIAVLFKNAMPFAGRDEEEKEEQWLIFHEAIAAKSSVTMPKPKISPQKGAQGGSGVNFAALSPVKVESMTSLEALRVEYSLVQSAVKAGHKDAATIQRGKQVCIVMGQDCIVYAKPSDMEHVHVHDTSIFYNMPLTQHCICDWL